MFPRTLTGVICALALSAAGGRAEGAGATVGTLAPLANFSRVAIEPTKTSIYIGTVSLTMPAFSREAETYRSSYVAKVFPYFFYNEHGTLTISLPNDGLQRLEKGEVVAFSGRARNSAGEERRVEGKATPAVDTAGMSGKIKVRVFVSKRVELIFNTTYRFERERQ